MTADDQRRTRLSVVEKLAEQLREADISLPEDNAGRHVELSVDDWSRSFEPVIGTCYALEPREVSG